MRAITLLNLSVIALAIATLIFFLVVLDKNLEPDPIYLKWKILSEMV